MFNISTVLYHDRHIQVLVTIWRWLQPHIKIKSADLRNALQR